MYAFSFVYFFDARQRNGHIKHKLGSSVRTILIQPKPYAPTDMSSSFASECRLSPPALEFSPHKREEIIRKRMQPLPYRLYLSLRTKE